MMRKALSLLLALAMLFTCAFSAVAETTVDTDTLKAAEMEALMEWLSSQISVEEAEQVLTWDRETILEKLEGYGQPLEYITKEEAADELMQVLSLFNLFSGIGESKDGGEAILGLLGGLLGGTGEEGEGLLGLFGGFTGGEDGFTGRGFGEWEPHDGYWVDLTFDGTFWESDETKLESVFQDGYYKVLVTEGEAEYVYLCEYEEFEQEEQYLVRLTGIGTGDEERTAQQPDQGETVFVYHPFEETLTWQRAEGSELVFTRMIDPLDGIQYYSGVNQLSIRWLGDHNYQVKIDNWVDFVSWSYQCVLDEETDVLTGEGTKDIFFSKSFEDDPAVFAFQNARNQLIWTSEKEDAAKDGLPFEHIEMDLIEASWWNEEGYWLSVGWVTSYYLVQVFDEAENAYTYLCTYDRDQTEAHKVQILQQRRKETFQKLYDAFAEGKDIYLNEELWAQVAMPEQKTTTSDFFDIFEKYMAE